MTAVDGGLITLEYAAAGLKYSGVGQAPNAVRDADLIAYIQAATPVIENIVGPVLPTELTRVFDGGGDVIKLPHRVTHITSVSAYDTLFPNWKCDLQASVLWAMSGYTKTIFPLGFRNISVVYGVGFDTVPATLQLATRELVRFLVQQGNQAQRPAYGDGVESTPMTPMGFAVPKRVIELCAPFMGLGGFA